MDLNSQISSEVKKNVQRIIRPETELEREIIANQEFVTGIMWGKPRNGHPEGQVIYHIGHVLENVNKYSNSENRANLRLIAIIHDSFKYNVDLSLPKSKENDHAVFARKFAEIFISDNEVLEVIELHDEAYNSWNEGNITGDWNAAKQRANQLIERLSSSIILYLLFYQCDNETGNKNAECFTWFTNLVRHNKM